MPLSPFQAGIASLLSANRSPDSYLAGGTALNLEPDSMRFSLDLDYFHDSVERVDSAFEADRLLLDARGYAVEVLLRQSGFMRVLVRKGDEKMKIEWAQDSAWRFMPPMRSRQAGFILHPVDLAINKLLALVGRDEVRDYLDIHEVISRILPLGALCWAATGKDPGFTPAMLIGLLRRRGRIRPEDIARLNLSGSVDLPVLKVSWLAVLDDAERFMHTRDPSELGCLYWSPDREVFIQPGPDDRVVLHFGKPGGVLPVLS